MMELWAGAELAVVVDAVRTGGDHGGHVYVELARALGRLPRRLLVFAVNGVEFGFGPELSPAVAAAVEPVARRVCDVLG
jgi:hydrogenase maturation protease